MAVRGIVLRKTASDIVISRWTEPIVLLLILVNVVVLTLQASRDVYSHPRPTGGGFFHFWEDWVLFGLFIAFTVEIAARILVSGLIFDPEKRPHAKTLRGKARLVWNRLVDKDEASTYRPATNRHAAEATGIPDLPYDRSANASSLALDKDASKDGAYSHRQESQASFAYPPPSAQPTLRSQRSTANLLSASQTLKSTLTTRRGLKTSTFHADVPFIQASQSQQIQTLLHHKAFLRHSWNRVDALAVLSFWLMFVLAITGVESKDAIYVSRALSTLRAARLLTITAGTSVRNFGLCVSRTYQF